VVFFVSGGASLSWPGSGFKLLVIALDWAAGAACFAAGAEPPR